jgi:hypothetical protein
MQHDFALSAGQSRFGDELARFHDYGDDLARFHDYCVRADECQHFADRYPALKEQYEGLADQWRHLATKTVH